MASITLDDLRASVEAKYAPYVIDLGDGKQVTLIQALRLPAAKRDRLMELQKTDDADADAESAEASVEKIREMISLAATDGSAVGDLFAAIGDDPAFLFEILKAYGESSQLGEASPSAE